MLIDVKCSLILIRTVLIEVEEATSSEKAEKLTINVLEYYSDLLDVFSNKLVNITMRLINTKHRIDLELGQMLSFGPIYPLAKNKL